MQDNQKHCESIMFSRCHGNLLETTGNNSSGNSFPLTNAHGYHERTTRMNNDNSDTRQNSSNDDSAYNDIKQNRLTASSPSYSYNNERSFRIRPVSGVKVTDIVV